MSVQCSSDADCTPSTYSTCKDDDTCKCVEANADYSQCVSCPNIKNDCPYWSGELCNNAVKDCGVTMPPNCPTVNPTCTGGGPGPGPDPGWPPKPPKNGSHCAKSDAWMIEMPSDGDYCQQSKSICEGPPKPPGEPGSGCAGHWCESGVGLDDCAAPIANPGDLKAFPETTTPFMGKNILTDPTMAMSVHYKCGGKDYGCGAPGNVEVAPDGKLTINSARASFAKDGTPGYVDVENGKFTFTDVDVSNIYATTVATMYTAELPMGPARNKNITTGVKPQGAWWEAGFLNPSCADHPEPCVTEPSGNFFAYADAQGCADFDGTVDPDDCPHDSEETNKAAAQNRIRAPEMDLFEANRDGINITAHTCSKENGNYTKCDGYGMAITANANPKKDPKHPNAHVILKYTEGTKTTECPDGFPSRVYGPDPSCPINTLEAIDTIEVDMKPTTFTAKITQNGNTIEGEQVVSEDGQTLLGTNHSLLATQWFIKGDAANASWLTGCTKSNPDPSSESCVVKGTDVLQSWTLGRLDQA